MTVRLTSVKGRDVAAHPCVLDLRHQSYRHKLSNLLPEVVIIRDVIDDTRCYHGHNNDIKRDKHSRYLL